MVVISGDQHRQRTTEHSAAKLEHLVSVDTQLDAGEVFLEHDRIPQFPIFHGQSFLRTAPAATDSGVISLTAFEYQEICLSSATDPARRRL